LHKFFAKTQFLGKKVVFLPECHSTNDEAQSLLSDRLIEGTTIITANQKNGKGQRGNSWESEPGKNAIFSTILKPKFLTPGNQFSLHLIASLAIHDALFSLLGKKLKIKWPNDIYYEDFKICGILIENTIRGNQIEYAIIGIGINVNQTNFEHPYASSLKDLTSSDHEVNELIEKALMSLESRYLQLKSNHLVSLTNDYYSRMYRFQKPHKYTDADGEFVGAIQGIDESGNLLVKKMQHTQSYRYKEIEFLQ